MSINRTIPAQSAQAITPGDSGTGAANGEVVVCRGVWVGGTGDLAVIMREQSVAVTFPGVAAGSLIPIDISRVMSTNTTATNIVVVW